MSVARQLYQLQEIDLELEQNEQALRQISSQLGNDEAVVKSREKLALEQKVLEDLQRQQRSVEGEIDSITGKITAAEEELYSGRIGNPKELSNLQQDVDSLKSQRSRLEDRALEVMDRVELATKSVKALDNELKTLETEWQKQQQKLSADLGQTKDRISNLQKERQSITTKIAPEAVEVYQFLKSHKGTVVARVEQGICRGCRISLPVSELQRIRGGDLVRCSSCGRILFLD